MHRSLAGRRVLVTGANGFFGAHLTRALAVAGADVHAFVRRPAGPAKGPAKAGYYREHIGDMLDADSIRAAVAAAEPEIVFHLAAYGTTPVQRDAALTRDVNVGGIERLWDALDGCPCRIVQTGTCAEYAPKAGALVEEDACDPLPGYASTLHEAVTFARDRARHTGRELTILRPFGPYGPGDRPERLVPHVIAALLSGHRVSVTAGEQRRDYSYVEDHVAALLSAATVPLVDTGRVYNIGSGQPIRVRTLIEQIAEAVDDRFVDRIDFGAVPYRPDDRIDRYADITAARRDLGYEPRVPLVEGLGRTVQAARAARAEAFQ